MEENISYNELIDELQQHYTQNKLDVYIPSKVGMSKVTPISVKQHKEILNVDSNLLLAGFNFNVNINTAILNNIENSADLLLIDKPAILLALRKSMSDGLTKFDIEGKQHQVDLSTNLDSISDIRFN